MSNSDIFNYISIIANVFTAIGTVAATIVALYFGLRENSCRINGVFLWDSSSDYTPMLLIENVGNRIVVVEEICIFYAGKKVGNISFTKEQSLRDYRIIRANEAKKVPISLEWLNFPKITNTSKIYTLKIEIKHRSGGKYVSKQRYTYNDLEGLFFLNGLDSGE